MLSRPGASGMSCRWVHEGAPPPGVVLAGIDPQLRAVGYLHDEGMLADLHHVRAVEIGPAIRHRECVRVVEGHEAMRGVSRFFLEFPAGSLQDRLRRFHSASHPLPESVPLRGAVEQEVPPGSAAPTDDGDQHLNRLPHCATSLDTFRHRRSGGTTHAPSPLRHIYRVRRPGMDHTIVRDTAVAFRSRR